MEAVMETLLRHACDGGLGGATLFQKASRNLPRQASTISSVQAWTIGLPTEPTTRQQSPCWRPLGWLAYHSKFHHATAILKWHTPS